MIHLTDNIMLVEVPEDAETFEIDDDFMYSYNKAGKLEYALQSKNLLKHTILGTIRNGKPDFDVEPYVENDTLITGLMEMKFYKSYWDKTYPYRTKEASFLSLIQSKKLDMSKHYLVIEKQ